MKTVLAIIVLCVVALSVTASHVYAERSVVEVPFDYTGNSCTFDESTVTYTCMWQGSSETVTKQGLKDGGIVPPEKILEESKVAHEEAVAQKEEDTQTPTEKKIEELIKESEEGRISSADQILLDLLTDLKASCELGIEHGELIQKYAEFELPLSDPRTDYKAINYKTNWQLGKIIMKIEECKGWDKYRVDILGQRYLDLEVDDSTTQRYHTQNIKALNATVTPVPKLTEQSFKDANQQAKDSICKASFYDAQFKKQMGCENAPIDKYQPITDNTISTSIPMKNYIEYMGTGFVDIETLKKKEVAKAHVQSLKSFALQHGIDLADLKNLVQGDKP